MTITAQLEVRHRCFAARSTVSSLALLSMLGVSACRPSDGGGSDTTPIAPDPTSTVQPWLVSDSGAGPLRIGMTIAQAASALRAAIPDTTNLDRACAYHPLPGLPGDLRLMWVDGRLARIDVDNDSLETAQGARVGDASSRIDSLYAGRVTTRPHKYLPKGSYLVVGAPIANVTGARIVFETDSTRRVTRYRVGREPEVEWVEGCA